MAISGFTTWEVQTGGSDTNGGGFVEGSSGTDYSQQTSAQLSLSDGMCMGTTNLNSSTGGFTSAMVGNILYLYSPTSMAAEWYEITAYVDTNNVTLDRSGPTDAGMTINVGGCLATPGGTAQATSSSTSSYGQHCWIKSGTYTLSTSTANTSGGPWNDTSSRVVLIAGYNNTRGDLDGQAAQTNKPIIDVGTQTSITVINLNSNTHNYMNLIKNIVVDGQSQASIIGFEHNGASGFRGASKNLNCHAIDCTTGFGLNDSFSCEASGCTTGFSGAAAYDCVAHSGTTGFMGLAVRCLAYRNTTGFDGPSNVVNCTAANNTGVGFYVKYTDEAFNCLSVGNGTGFDFDGSRRCGSFNMVVYNNTTDFGITLSAWSGTRHWNQLHTLTADPFVDSAGDDYSLNDNPGGGGLLKQLGMSIPTQSNDRPDFGAIQTKILDGAVTTHPLRSTR